MYQNDSIYQKQSVLRKSERGMTFVEILIVAFVLAVVGFGSAYHIAQSKMIMKSTTQRDSCPKLTRETLEQFITFGTRLYGYSYDGSLAHAKTYPKFRPLLLSRSGTGVSNFNDLKNGSSLKFPGFINNVFNQLSINIGGGLAGDWANTGVDIIEIDSSDKIHLGSSIFLINQVNVLQYLYNSDVAFFTGNVVSGQAMGKKFSMNSHPELKKYAEKYGLQDLNLYILIRPVNLKTREAISHSDSQLNSKVQDCTYTSTNSSPQCSNSSGTRPKILTRPRLASGIVPHPNVVLHGNPHLGFELKVTLAYEYRDSKGTSQDLSCEAMQTFTHQMDTIKRTNAPQGVQLASSSSSIYEDIKSPYKHRENDGEDDRNVLTSCGPDNSKGSHGTSYNDITVEVDFNVQSKERGTLIVCQGRTGCRSGNSTASYSGNGINCTPAQGKWTRCHKVKFPGQSGTTQAEMTTSNRLRLTFNDLPDNKRFDLYVAELSTAGTLSDQEHISRFYIDAKRPTIKNRSIPDDDVGKPNDGGTGGRNYRAHSSVSWSKPSDTVSSSKWLQCNTNDVSFESDQEDQFTHNFKECEGESERRDGSSTSDTSSDLTIDDTSATNFRKCKGKLSGIAHGRQKITLTPKDSCEKGTTSNIVWDTDLPNTFNSQDFNFSSDFGSDIKGFESTDGPAYSIDTVLPATGSGKFPKHYTADCHGKWWPNTSGSRDDGDGGTLSCDLNQQKSDTDDGCNPEGFGADYWHVCGGSKQTEVGVKWAVFAPDGESCSKVRCETSSICCDGFNNDCGSVSNYECETNSCSNCTNPNVGGNSQQDSNSGCPPLGLCSCSGYKADCIGTNISRTKTDGCPSGKRSGGSCSFSASGTCNLTGTASWGNSCSDSGKCDLDNSGCNTGCDDKEVNCRNCNPYSCNCTDHDSNPNTPDQCQTCYNTCCDTKYKAYSSSTCTRTVLGTCGAVSGGSCSQKTHLPITRGDTDELCHVRKPGTATSCTKINGACSSLKCRCSTGTPTTCNRGTQSTTWSCSGSCNGSTASCTKYEVPLCGSSSGGSSCNDSSSNTSSCCQIGTYNSSPTDTSNQAQWQCQNGTQTTNCSESRNACGSGTCEDTDTNTSTCCQVGTYNSSPTDSQNKMLWTCRDGSNTYNCDAPIIPTTIACGPGSANCSDSGSGTGCCVGTGATFKANPKDTKTEYEWTCQNNSKSLPCDATKDKCGTKTGDACSDTSKKNKDVCCVAGQYKGTPTDGTNEYKWSCGTITSCQEKKKENGKCATAPYTARADACEDGTPESFSATPSGHTWTWTWICKGTNGGTNDNCSHTCTNSMAFKDDCNAPANSTGCHRVGSSHPHKTAGCWNFECHNCYEWVLSSWSCNRNTSYPSECSSRASYFTPNLTCPNTCSGGSPSCTGSGEYASETACKNQLPSGKECYQDGNCWKRRDVGNPVDGDCNESQVWGCHSGTANRHNPLDTNTHHKWTCEGSNGGKDSSPCEKKKTPNVPDPQCGSGSSCGTGTGVSGCCNPGHHNPHPPDSNTEWKWTCRKTANSSAGEITCSETIPPPPSSTTTTTPACNGSGEHTSKSACEAVTGLHSTFISPIILKRAKSDRTMDFHLFQHHQPPH